LLPWGLSFSNKPLPRDPQHAVGAERRRSVLLFIIIAYSLISIPKP
jgi:hypothetical protein